MIEASEVERKEVVEKCSQFLGEIWTKVKDEQIECQRIIAGISNRVFHVWIKNFDDLTKNGDENCDVIVRLYGAENGKQNPLKLNGEAGEAIVHRKLYEEGLAPKLLGVFDGGRIEEYIPSRPVTMDELSSIDLCKEVARKLAKFHTIEVPISKKPNLIEKFASIVQRKELSAEDIERLSNESDECATILKFPFDDEVTWFNRVLPIITQQVIFSHNDLNPNNILLKEKPNSEDDKIMLIDYEMSTYFYRGYDLAYFLRAKNCSLQIEFSKISLDLGEKDEQFPTQEFLQEYLNEYSKLRENRFDTVYDNVEALEMEVDFCDLAYDLILIGMAKFIILDTNTSFALSSDAKIASEYEQKKQKVISKYGAPLPWSF